MAWACWDTGPAELMDSVVRVRSCSGREKTDPGGVWAGGRWSGVGYVAVGSSGGRRPCNLRCGWRGQRHTLGVS